MESPSPVVALGLSDDWDHERDSFVNGIHEAWCFFSCA